MKRVCPTRMQKAYKVVGENGKQTRSVRADIVHNRTQRDKAPALASNEKKMEERGAAEDITRQIQTQTPTALISALDHGISGHRRRKISYAPKRKEPCFKNCGIILN